MEHFYNLSMADLRNQEYPMMQDVVYLDHAGSTPVAKSLATRFAKDLSSHLFGNPHSASPSSERSTRRVDSVRAALLRFFRADPEHYDLVFTANTTAAIKLVADAFRDLDEGFWYGFQKDAHTSLVGVREYASSAKCFETDFELETFLKGEDIGAIQAQSEMRGLFAWPAQSNMNGRRLPLDLAGRVRATTPAGTKMYTMLDAAAFCTTGQLNLSNVETSPDFVALSLHKIFGFPDMGALLIRREAADVFMSRRYFGGGTVEMVTVIREQWVSRRETQLHERLEDGTLPFHQIVALDSALAVHAEVYGCQSNITKHTCALAANLYKRLRALRHANGTPVCEIYKDPKAQYGNSKTQGPTVAFNIRNAQGGWVGKSDVEALAVARGIHLRTGGVCNPGGIASVCALEHWEMRRNFAEGMRCGDNFDVLGGKPTGVVRVSLGAMSTQDEVDQFLEFVEAIFVETDLAPHPFQYVPVPAASPSSSTANVEESGPATVDAIRIFPVRGCAGWKIPHYVSWGISERGLSWDREWCIVSTEQPGVVLDPSQHPRMSLIAPVVSAERGTLRLVGPKAAPSKSVYLEDRQPEPCISFDPVSAIPGAHLAQLDKPRQASVVVSALEVDEADNRGEEVSIEISLWESPAPTTSQSADPGMPPADVYESSAVANFCSAVLGVPCTLARFRDLRKLAKDAPDASRHLPVSERSVVITSAETDGDAAICAGNVGVVGEAKWQAHRYIKIGAEYFENPQAKEATQTSANAPLAFNDLIHLKNTFDRSRAAAYPTIAAGDLVQTFSPEAALRDQGLQACVASSFVTGHLCAVWNCRKAFATRELLQQHFSDHRHTKVKPATKTKPPAKIEIGTNAPVSTAIVPSSAGLPKSAEIKILQMAVNLPQPLSEKLMAATGAGVEVQTPTSTYTTRSSKRQSFRNRLSTLIARPNSIINVQKA